LPKFHCDKSFSFNLPIQQVDIHKLLATGGDFSGKYTYAMYSSCDDKTYHIADAMVFNQSFTGAVTPGLPGQKPSGTINFNDFGGLGNGPWRVEFNGFFSMAL
jgi:hypothetical protein